MLRKIDDFLKTWEYESESTGKILNSLTNQSLSQKVTPVGAVSAFSAGT